MRKIAEIFGVAGLLLGFAAIGFAADPPANNKDVKADAKDKTSQLAENIFNRADSHKHGYLNKIEFKKADTDLATAINKMSPADLRQLAGDTSNWRRGQGNNGQGNNGQNNNGQGNNANGQSNPPTFVRGFASADTDNDKKVTLAEFTDYTGRAIAAADDYMKQQAQAAQQAAQQARASGYGGAGGGVGRGR